MIRATQRFDHDVAGMPAFAAEDNLKLVLSAINMMEAVPTDDENCALAKACRIQFQTPHVSVGRSRTDIALPHPQGVAKPGFGETKWAVIRFGNSKDVREVIIKVDTGEAVEEGAVVEFLPFRLSLLPEVKRKRNKQFRKPKGVKDGRGKSAGEIDELTLMGVRTLTGQRHR